ncbi:hypothetical protein Sjap_024904 [Stephania japonica]|uniref:Uncharacterized protein n=1 Tax=Stephania japonica TaxID=461633 RepID=A0AAP0EJ57_9MAGN
MKAVCNSCHTELKKQCFCCWRYMGDFRSLGVECHALRLYTGATRLVAIARDS